MTELHEYLNDGASYQARAVMCFLQRGDNLIDSSWSDEKKRHEAHVYIARWENCREQGYIVSMKSKDYEKQLNIAFFEHRNADSICAVRWEQFSENSITIDTAKFGDVYKDKRDVSHSERWGKAKEMADWIVLQFEEFWEETSVMDKN